MAMGVNYGRDDFSTYQKSRNANPPPDPSWTDPNRDWTLDNDEKVNNFDVYFDLLNMFKNTGIRFAYTYSDSDNALVLGGPRTVTLFNTIDANGFRTFEQLPNVTNDWQQFTIDLKYSFNAKIGFAVGYFYEKLGITDFATINLPGTDQPRIDYLGGLTTGTATGRTTAARSRRACSTRSRRPSPRSHAGPAAPRGRPARFCTRRQSSRLADSGAGPPRI